MGKMTEEIMGVFNDPKAGKALATESSEGLLNNVTIGSLVAMDPEILAFADMFMNKTKANLKATKKACAVAVLMPATPEEPPKGFQVKGTFLGFQTSGPLYDYFSEMVKKQMGIGIRGVGTIAVEEGYTITPGAGSQQVF